MTPVKLTKKARQVLVAQAMRESKKIRQIADELGVHRHTVERDIAELTDSLASWADGEIHETMLAAMADYRWAKEAARTAFNEDRVKFEKWLAGEYDRVEFAPDPDGGAREVRKPPILRMETGTYLSQFISANQKLTKMLGIEGAEKHEHSGPGGGALSVRWLTPSEAEELIARAREQKAAETAMRKGRRRDGHDTGDARDA